MISLSFREKIIISLVAAAVLFALISLLHPSSSTGTVDRSKQLTAELTDFSSKMAIQVARDGLSPFESAAIQKAAEPWTKDPFLNLKHQNQVTEDLSGESRDTAELSYSGYLRMGARMLAIIDGIEYETGERLSDYPGLVLRRISFDRVVLVQEDTGARIVVPIERDRSGAGTPVPPEYSTRRRMSKGIDTDLEPGPTYRPDRPGDTRTR